MRTKPIIYIAAAILLGFALMIAPKTIQTGPDLTLFPSPPAEDTYSNAQSLEDAGKFRSVYGLDQPLNLLPFSLILLIGLIVATGIYVTFKKRLA